MKYIHESFLSWTFMLRTLLYVGIALSFVGCWSAPDSCMSARVDVIRITADTLFDHPQQIQIASISGEELAAASFQIAHFHEAMLRTDDFAERFGAWMAINGSYFDMDQGGSVTFFEEQDTMVYATRKRGKPWAMTPRILDGAVVIDKQGELIVESARGAKEYLASKEEAQVLVTGPLLMKDGRKTKLSKMEFAGDLHPRSCLCIGEDFVSFITADGRQRKSAGLNLVDLQDYVASLGCRDAINLDGGGSTTLVVEGCGIINSPSDITGPRPVANVLIAVPKKK